MATMDELKIWLEVARNLAPKIGVMALVISLVYLARQTWRTRTDWRLGPPWSAYAHYLKKLRTDFAFTSPLDFSKNAALYLIAANPESGKRFNPNEVYDLNGVMNLAVHEHKLIVLIGAPACGKTALLHMLALRASSPATHRELGFTKTRIPFYVSLQTLNLQLPFAAAISAALKAAGFSLRAAQVKQALRRGRALFLFDGVEELSSSTQQTFLRWLNEALAGEVGKAQLVIASRSETWLGQGEIQANYFLVLLRNFAQQKIRTLSAVTETRMPAILRNAVEAEAEYILITPPAHAVLLRGAHHPAPRYYYHLARYPVTNRLYRAFIRAQGPNSVLLRQEIENSDDDLPCVRVDWTDAGRYCEWLNQQSTSNRHEGLVFRLPTEEEWEWAASGASRVYPWGNAAPTTQHANFGAENSQLTSVFAHPLGATPEGVRELAGNVWEWTATRVQSKPEKFVVRGGAAFNDANTLQCAARDSHSNERSRFVGFRVVRGPSL